MNPLEDPGEKQVVITPFALGPRFHQDKRPPLVHAFAEHIVLRFRTEPSAVRPLVPNGIEVTENPVVSVVCSEYKGVAHLAGNGYRRSALAVSARFCGERDELEGDFVLVAFLDRALPVIMGRELEGMPNQDGTISPIQSLAGERARCDVSMWGHLMFQVDIEGAEVVVDAEAIEAISKALSDRPALGYKYFMGLDGTVEADYPTAVWTDHNVESLWKAEKGTLQFGKPTDEDIADYVDILDPLRALPVLEVTDAFHARGSMVLRYDRCRRLR